MRRLRAKCPNAQRIASHPTLSALFFIPLGLEPPENLPYRRAMTPMFGPIAIKAIAPQIRARAEKLVNDVVAGGRCDFQADVSKGRPLNRTG